MRRLRPLGLALSLALAYPVAQGLPQGAQVVNGQVTINPGLIQQGSDKAIVNWQSFSIAAGETLRVQQPGINSVLLNRVVGGDPSLILGQLQANGRVFLVNPRGIVFGRGSQVDAGSLVASTLDLSDTAFLAGNYRFSAGAGAGGLQADGSISAPGGTVALLAPQLSVGGSIAARRVGLGAASTVQVDVEGDGLVLFNLRTDDDRDIALKFNGRVQAEASAEVRAQARGGAAGQVLNMDGIVQARGLSQQGGRIVIDGGTAGITSVNGNADASGETGGHITVLGQKLALLDGARLDASGRLGGGALQVGGGFEGQGTAHNAAQTWIGAGAELRADATSQGDGGRVAVWADGRTDMLGSIYARGGRLGGNGGAVETSGRQRLNLSGTVDASAPLGRPGQWLLDPNDIVIKSNSGTNTNVGASPNFASTNDSAVVDVGALNTALTGGTAVTVQTTSSGANTQQGDIDVKAAITSTGTATLNLIAIRNINFSTGSVAAGTGPLTLNLQAGGSITGSTLNTGGGALSATSTGGTIALGSVTSTGLSITSGGGNVTLPTGTVSGNLSVGSGGGAVTQAGALVVTGTTGVTAGAGDITLTANNNNLQGAVSLTSTGTTQISNGNNHVLTLGTLSTHDLTVTSNADLNLGSGTVTGNLVVATGGGNLTQGGALTVTGTTGITSGSGDITLTSANNLQGAVDLSTTGTTQLSNGAHALTLGTLSTRALTVSTSNAALDLGSGSVNGTLNATTGGGTVTQTGALSVTGAVDVNAGAGDITLTSANNLQGTVSLTSTGTSQLTNGNNHNLTLGILSTHDLTVTASSADVDLGSGTVTGALNVTTGGGNLTQSGALTVTGASSLSTGSGDITLTQANNLQGAVSLTTTGITQLSNGSGNALTLGTLSTHRLTVTTSNAALNLGSGTVTGNLSAASSGGAISQGGALTVTGTTGLNAGAGDITLTSANNLQGVVTLTSTGTSQLDNGSHALSLGTLSTHALTVTTSNADIDLGSGTVTGALSVTTGGGAVTQSGALTVTGTSSVNAGAGDITLTTANNNLQGAISLTSSGTTQVGNGSGLALTLGTLNIQGLNVSTTGGADLNLGQGTISGNLVATSNGGAITQGGALTVTGTTGLNAGAGNITLTSANDLQGLVSLTSTGTTQVSNGAHALTLGTLNTHALTVGTNNAALNLGSGTVAGTLGATSSGGAVTQGGALTVTGASSIDAGAGDITLTTAGNNLAGAVSLTSTGTTQIANGNSHALALGTLNTHALTVTTSSANLDLGSGSVTGALVVNSGGGDVTQTGALTVTGTTGISSGAGDITLTQANNLQGAVSLTTTGATQISNGSGNALTLGTLSTHALTVGTSNAALNLGSGTVTGNLSAASSGGSISQGGALTVTGTTGLNAGAGDITLTSANNLQGVVTLTSTGTSQLDNGSHALSLGTLSTHDLSLTTSNADIDLGSGTVTGALSVTTGGGAVTQSGALTVTGTSSVNAGAGNITLTTANNNLQGAISLTSSGTTQVGNGSGHALTLGTLNIQGLNVSTTGGADLNLGQGTISGNLVATSNGGAITQGGALTVTGTTGLNAGAGNITLTSANDLQGAVSLTSTGTSQLSNGAGHALALGTLNTHALTVSTSAANLNLGSGTVAGNLSATSSGGAISQGGALTVTGTSSIDAGAGSITLTSANNLQGTVDLTSTGTTQIANGAGHALTLGALSTHDLTVTTSNAALNLGSGTVTGNLVAASSGGAISQGGALTVTGTSSINAGAGDITLTSGNNLQGAVTLTSTGTTQVSNGAGHALTLGTLSTHALTVSTSAAGLNLGSGSITGNLGVSTAGGTVTQAGALTVTGTTGINAGAGNITLTSANNLQGAVSLTAAGATQVSNGGSNALTLGTLNTGNLTVNTAGGALNLGGGSVTGTLNASSSGGAISQTAALTVTGITTLNATTAGDINLPNTGNQWHGLNLTGNSLDLRSGGDLAILSLTQPADRALTLSAGGNLSLGPAASINTGSADLKLASLGGSFTQGGTLAGTNVELQAQTGLVLSQDITAAGTLKLTTAGGGISQTGGSIHASGATTVSAGTSAISLNRAGNHFGAAVGLSGGATGITDSGALTLGQLSTGALTVTSTGALQLGQGTVTGTLNATSNGFAITQAGGLTLTGATALNAGNADITLNDASNNLQGAVTATAGAVALRSANNLNLFALTQTPNKGLELEAGGTLTLPAGTGNIDTGTEALKLSSGGVFATFGTLKGGDITLKGQSATLAHDITASGVLSVTATGGAINQTGGRISAAGASSFDAGSQAITLGGALNDFQGLVTLTGGAAQIVSQHGLSLDTLHVASLQAQAGGALLLGSGALSGNLGATASGAITQASGGLQVTGTSSFSAGANAITLLDSANAWTGAVTLNGGATQLKGGGAVLLGGGSVASLALTAGGAVTQNAGLTVAGALGVDAGSTAITLNHASNHLNGTVTLTGGATQVRSAGALTLAALSTGALTAQSSGNLNLGQGTVGGNLVASSGGGAISQAGALDIAGSADIQAGAGSITLTQGGNQWGGVLSLGGGTTQVTSSSGLALGMLSVGALTADATGALGLGQGSVGGSLTANSHGGAITQTGALDVTGVAQLTSGGAGITLNQAGNQWRSAVNISGGATQIRSAAGLTLGMLATGNLDATSAGALSLGQGTIAGNLSAVSGGAVTQSGALQVTGSASLDAGAADITLTQTGNQFLGTLSLTGGAAVLFNQPSLVFGTLSLNSLDATSGGGITLGSGVLGGALTAKALGGTVTQAAGGLTVAGTTTLQAAADITMSQANHFQGLVNLSGGATSLSNATDLRLGTLATGALTLNASGTLDLGSGSIGGALIATSSGALTQAGALAVGGTSTLDAGTAPITLTQAGNAFAGAVSLRGGSTQLSNGGALSLSHLDVGDLTVSSTGALQLGTGVVGGALNANSHGGAMVQAAGGLSVSGASTLDAGAGAITLADAANAFTGLVHLQGGDASLASSGALRLGSFAVNKLTLSAGGDLDLGGGSVNGDLSATTRGTRIGQAGALTVGGSSSFIADGSLVDLVLNQPGNQWLGTVNMRGVNGGSFASADIGSALDLSVSGDVQTLTLSSGGLLTLGGGQSTTLTAAAGSGIVQTGALQVSGLTTLVAQGGAALPVDLSKAGNDLNRIQLTGQAGGSLGRVQLRDGDAARGDGLKVSGDASGLEITSAGALELGGGRYASLAADTSASGAAVTQSGALSVSGLATLKAGSGDITLTRADNTLASLTVGSAGTARLVSAGDYTVNASSVASQLDLGGPGAIGLAGPLSGAGELVMSGTGSLTVNTAQGHAGGTRIRAGTLVLQGPAAQLGGGTVQLGAAGLLDLRDDAVLANALLAQGGSVLNTSGHGTLAGPVTLQATTAFVPGAGGLTVSGALGDGGAGLGLRLAGSGTLTLAGSNSYSGTTDIAAGTLRATGVGALPSTSAVQLAAGAVLALGQDQTAGSLSGAGSVELGSFTLATGADNRDSSFSGSLNGSGGLTKLGSGRFTLSGNGAQTGTTRVAAGELVLASATALNDATAVSVDAGATLTVQQSAALGSLAGAGTVDLQAPLLAVGSNGSSTRWSGVLIGSGALAKRGAGVFTLAGHNSFAGDVGVEAGTLQLEGAGPRRLAAGAPTGPVVPASAGVNVASGATLELLTDIDLGALTGAGQVQLNAATLTLGASGRGGRFDGVMAGSGGLTKAGSGTLTLGGANLYTGATAVTGGTLDLAAAQALSTSSALRIEAPARVVVDARQAVASLNGNGDLVLNGATLATGADGADSRFDGVISGSGGLVKQGAGTLTLTAANTQSGATSIEAGTVKLTDQGSLGSGEIQNQGQLLLARPDAFTLEQAISGRGSLVITQGQVTLANGGNSYGGATQVQGGSLITTAAERLPDATDVQLAAGAQLQLGGNETIASLQAAGSVRLAGDLTTRGQQVYTGSLALANAAGLTLSGTLVDASHSANQFAGTPLGLNGGQALVTVKETLQLGNVTLGNGGRIEAERLILNGKVQLSGGNLDLVATAVPDDAKATLQGIAQVPVAGLPMAIAEATVQQGSSGAITVADGARLAVQATGGGSVLLAQDANSFKGQLSVLSGAKFDTAWVPNAKVGQAVQSLVHVAGQQVSVGGSGIEADVVHIRAEQLATVDSAKLVARLPFDEIVLGKALSAPGMTLELAPGAFGNAGSFGAVNGAPLQVEVGTTRTGARTTGPNAGYLTVLPKGGAQGQTAIVLAGPEVGAGYRFFHDGARQATEIPVIYNGVLPLTPAASGALSSINGDAEDARRARFQETVRTENVTVRLRSGVIAEVGPGRPSTQGSEGVRPPEPCDPAQQPVLSCKPSSAP
ncbi:MAG TPA: autotransporter-associated beta strand repeat-containing protein [Roseateles sp.]